MSMIIFLIKKYKRGPKRNYQSNTKRNIQKRQFSTAHAAVAMISVSSAKTTLTNAEDYPTKN